MLQSATEYRERPPCQPGPCLHRRYWLFPCPDSLPTSLLPYLACHRAQMCLLVWRRPPFRRRCPGNLKSLCSTADHGPHCERNWRRRYVHHVGHRHCRPHAASSKSILDRRLTGLRGVGNYLWALHRGVALQAVQLGEYINDFPQLHWSIAYTPFMPSLPRREKNANGTSDLFSV